MPWLHLCLLFLICLILSIAGTGFVLAYLRKRNILDLPNQRSNHTIPTPRGGGIALVAVMLPAWLYISYTLHQQFTIWPIIVATLLLAAVSFRDDIKPVPVRWRLGVQLVAVIIGLSFIYRDPSHLVFQGMLPIWLDMALSGIFWLWFINLYNFMDGINGITGSESVSIGVGIIVIAILLQLPTEIAWYANVLTAVALGFLVWNWDPARIFMGDVGSIPLGFLFGFLLLTLAIQGHLAAAWILPGYYLADSTYTITKRLLQKKKIWQAHSEHFYQQAVRSGKSHAFVVTCIIVTNIFLIVLGLTSALYTGYVWHSIMLALLVVGLVLWTFSRGGARG